MPFEGFILVGQRSRSPGQLSSYYWENFNILGMCNLEGYTGDKFNLNGMMKFVCDRYVCRDSHLLDLMNHRFAKSPVMYFCHI